jgi:hypothetical protein
VAAFVTTYEFIALELNQKFGHPRTRSSYQVSQILTQKVGKSTYRSGQQKDSIWLTAAPHPLK